MEEIINKIFSKHNTTALKVKPYAPLTKVSMTAVEVNKLIQELPSEERGKVSDGFHSFSELYTHRCQLWITLCSL